MQVDIIEIDIDLKWSLDDFSFMTKMYIQCYSLLYSLSNIDLPDAEYNKFQEYIKGEYAKYPWRGGYSAVNFYRSIYNKIPFEHRPEIYSINYASPGKIKLKEVAVVAALLATITVSVTKSIDNIHDTYNKIQKGMSERKLARIDIELKELELRQSEMQFVNDSFDALANELDLSQELLQELDRKTAGNKLMQLKILLSLYRRIEPLALMQAGGYLDLQATDSDI